MSTARRSVARAGVAGTQERVGSTDVTSRPGDSSVAAPPRASSHCGSAPALEDPPRPDEQPASPAYFIVVYIKTAVCTRHRAVSPARPHVPHHGFRLHADALAGPLSRSASLKCVTHRSLLSPDFSGFWSRWGFMAACRRECMSMLCPGVWGFWLQAHELRMSVQFRWKICDAGVFF